MGREWWVGARIQCNGVAGKMNTGKIKMKPYSVVMYGIIKILKSANYTETNLVSW